MTSNLSSSAVIPRYHLSLPHAGATTGATATEQLHSMAYPRQKAPTNLLKCLELDQTYLGHPLLRRQQYVTNGLATTDCMHTTDIMGHHGCVNAVAFSNLGEEFLVTGVLDGWQYVLPKCLSCPPPFPPIHTYTHTTNARTTHAHCTHHTCTHYMCSSTHHTHTGGDDERVLVWRLAEVMHGKRHPTIMAGRHQSNVFSAVFSCDNAYIYSGGEQHTIGYRNRNSIFLPTSSPCRQ